MASVYARRNTDNTALLEYPLRARDLNQTGRNYGPDPQDATLADSDFVLVRETEKPVTTFGQTIEEGAPEKQGDGHWHKTWVVFDPSPERAEEIRADLKAMAEAVAADKRTEMTTAHIVTFMELERLAVDATPTAAEYPLINAIALGRSDGGSPMTFGQAANAAVTFRDNWVARAAAVERKYHDVIVRIDAASTLAEAKAIFDELEALA